MLLTSLDAPGVPGGALSWPGARAMFDNAFDLNLERRIKYLWRLALTWNVRGSLLREVDGHAMIEALFRAQPRAFYPMMNHLIDRRMGAQARLRTTLASLRVVCGSAPTTTWSSPLRPRSSTPASTCWCAAPTSRARTCCASAGST